MVLVVSIVVGAVVILKHYWAEVLADVLYVEAVGAQAVL